MPAPSPLHLAVALEGAGWHPAAWREAGARPAQLFSPGYWVNLVATAEQSTLDFVTIEDGLGLQSSRWDGPDGRRDQVRGRLDAVLVAARAAPRTSRIGLVPTATTTHTEPFHVSKSIATLDIVSNGRAGWRAQISPRRAEAGHFGRRTLPLVKPGSARDDPVARQVFDDLMDEAGDFVEVVRRLWDSWEDDAEIRDASTGRFVNRDRLHYIDFEGRWFSVRGPSITPRPPQGQPVVAVLAHGEPVVGLAARQADVVFVTPTDADDLRRMVADVRAAEGAVRRHAPLVVFADLLVVLHPGGAPAAQARLRRLDGLDGAPLRTDAAVFAGSSVELADLLTEWQAAGADGFRLRPAVLPTDLVHIADGLVPELRRRGAFRRAYETATLRGHLGLARPANRYAPARPVAGATKG